MLEFLAQPFVLFVDRPWLALIPAAAFFWLYRRQGRKAAVLASGLWLLYGLWEISFSFRSVREWIRIDLLLIAPLLIAASAWAIITALAIERRSQ